MWRALALATLMWSCGGTPTSSVSPAAKPAGSPVGGASHAAAAPVPPAVRATYRRHLAAGRKLAATKRWGEAAAEFEGALQAIPMDGRALSELAWAAFQSGDHGKARKVGADAVRVTSEPRLKAASLYNLGRATEAAGDVAGAARLYARSLSLRSNKTVADRLARLGRKPPAAGAPVETPPCTEPAAQVAVCDCLVKESESDNPDDSWDVACELVEDADAPEGVAIARVDTASNEHDFYLLVERGRRWAVGAVLAHLYGGGSSGIYNELGWETLEERTLGGAKLLWIEWTESGYDHDAGINETESHSTRNVALCVLDAPRLARPACPLTVPLSWEFDRDILIDEDEDQLTDEEKKLHTPGLPIHEERKLDVHLAADGTATVKLLKGRADDRVKALLGVHKLF